MSRRKRKEETKKKEKDELEEKVSMVVNEWRKVKPKEM